MINEREKIWKEAIVAYSRDYPDICLKVVRKITRTSVRIAGVPTGIRIGDIQNTSVKPYLYPNLLTVGYIDIIWGKVEYARL
jgi:hypothetical protein